MLINSLDARSDAAPHALSSKLTQTHTPLTTTLTPKANASAHSEKKEEVHKKDPEEGDEGEGKGLYPPDLADAKFTDETSPRGITKGTTPPVPRKSVVSTVEDKEKDKSPQRALSLKSRVVDIEAGKAQDKQSHPPPQQSAQKQYSIHDPDFGSDPTPDPVDTETEKEPLTTTTMTTTITKNYGSDLGPTRNRFLSTVVTSNEVHGSSGQTMPMAPALPRHPPNSGVNHTDYVIVTLLELFLDPYYRTLEGFCVLLDKEWVTYG